MPMATAIANRPDEKLGKAPNLLSVPGVPFMLGKAGMRGNCGQEKSGAGSGEKFDAFLGKRQALSPEERQSCAAD